MQQSILVLTPGRTGSSAIAGALHLLGVPMSESVGHLDNIERPFAQAGLFEDTAFWEINYQTWQREIDEATSLASYGYMVWKRNDIPIWGLKDPQAVHCFEVFAPLLPNMRLIISLRDEEEAVQSYLKAFGGGEYLANLVPTGVSEEQFVRDLLYQRLEIIERIKSQDRWPHLAVHYDDLLQNPVGWVSTVAAFAFDELKIYPHPDSLLDAVKHIDPSLRSIG